MSWSTTCSAPTASGAICRSASSPTWWRRPICSRWLDGRKLDAVIHLGAISDTTATDGDLVMENNFRLSLRLLDWCTRPARRSSMRRRPRPMATARRVSPTTGRPRRSSAQADESLRLEQASVRSRVAERASKKEKLPPQWAGLKFFNVFGPNEYHKGEMMSLVWQGVRRRQGRRADPAVQVASRRHRGRRAAPRFHLCRRRGRGGALAAGDARRVRHLQCRHRQGAQLPGPDHGDVCGARPRAEHRIRRHAGRNPRPVSVFHASRGRQPAPRRLQRRLHAAGRAVGRYVTQFLDREDRYR